MGRLADPPPKLAAYVATRGRAEAAIRAFLAARSGSVRLFRQRFLGDRLLRSDEVADWVQAAEHGRRDPPTGPGRPPNHLLILDPWKPFAPGPELVYVQAGSALDELRRVAQSQADRMGWWEAHAVWFVLTGTAVPVDPLQVREGYSPLEGHRGRFVLSVEPWVPAELVADRYRAYQRAVADGVPRMLGMDKLALAIFLAGRLTQAPPSWADLMAAWNAAHPERTYTSTASMQRDWLRVRRALSPRSTVRGANRPSRADDGDGAEALDRAWAAAASEHKAS